MGRFAKWVVDETIANASQTGMHHLELTGYAQLIESHVPVSVSFSFSWSHILRYQATMVWLCVTATFNVTTTR